MKRLRPSLGAILALGVIGSIFLPSSPSGSSPDRIRSGKIPAFWASAEPGVDSSKTFASLGGEDRITVAEATLGADPPMNDQAVVLSTTLPHDVGQGRNGRFLAIEVSLGLTLRPASAGAGVASIYLNGRGFVQLQIAQTPDGQHVSVGQNTALGRVESLFDVGHSQQRVHIKVLNYPQTASVMPGPAMITAAIVNYDERIVDSMTVFSSSRLIYTRDEPSVPHVGVRSTQIVSRHSGMVALDLTFQDESLPPWDSPNLRLDLEGPVRTIADVQLSDMRVFSKERPVHFVAKNLVDGKYRATMTIVSRNRLTRHISIGSVTVAGLGSSGDSGNDWTFVKIAGALGSLAVAAVGIRLVVRSSGRQYRSGPHDV